MIAVDTNVLIRLLMADDAAQAAKARRLLDAQAEADKPIWVSDTVLVELLWTLSRAYGRTREDLAAALRALSRNASVAFESSEAVGAALELFTQGGADFADCLLCVKAANAGCDHLMTFVKGMKHLPGVRVI